MLANDMKKYKCPMEYTLDIMGGKWKLVILWQLAVDDVRRYGEIKKSVTGITHKMLSQQLKELEADGLIHRQEYRQIPPKVEYSLSEKGISLIPVLKTMCDWGREHMDSGTGSCELSAELAAEKEDEIA